MTEFIMNAELTASRLCGMAKLAMTRQCATSSVMAALLSVVLSLTAGLGCRLGSRLRPNLAASPLGTMRMQPDRAWTDTGLIVEAGEQLFIAANGEVVWAVRNATAGPDGVNGYPGWNLGAGALIGRVGETKPFAIGARTQPFLNKGSLRHHRYYPAPPIRMPASGRLELGFKDFRQGANGGGFEIAIRRAQ